MSGHTQFRTQEACRRNEGSGAARQVVFIKDPVNNKSEKTKVLNPKDQAEDGSIAVKKGTWELATGVLENLAKALGQNMIDRTLQERTFFPRHDSLFAPNPTSTSTYHSPLSLPSTHMLIICTCIHILMLLKCSYMLQVVGFCSSFKHVWKAGLNCLDLGLN